MYTINGKEYSEFDINKRCAEILAWESEPNVKSVKYGGVGHECFWVESVGFHAFPIEAYCTNPSDTWSIIEKCWDELSEPIRYDFEFITTWKHIIKNITAQN